MQPGISLLNIKSLMQPGISLLNIKSLMQPGISLLNIKSLMQPGISLLNIKSPKSVSETQLNHNCRNLADKGWRVALSAHYRLILVVIVSGLVQAKPQPKSGENRWIYSVQLHKEWTEAADNEMISSWCYLYAVKVKNATDSSNFNFVFSNFLNNNCGFQT